MKPTPADRSEPDLQFADLRSFASCRAVTRKGRYWLKRNVPDSLGGYVLIEFRYLEDIVLGARADGLVCHG